MSVGLKISETVSHGMLDVIIKKNSENYAKRHFSQLHHYNTVQKYANWHVWDSNTSNATIYHEIKVGILDNTCFKENVLTFEILVGWILKLGLNFWVINVALYD